MLSEAKNIQAKDLTKETVKEIAQDLCAFFNQESVMVTELPARTYFVKDSISMQD